MGEISRKHIPMFRYAFLLAAGICFAQYVYTPVWAALSVALAAVGYIVYRQFYTTSHYKIHVFVSIAVAVLALGMMRQQIWQQRETPAVKRLRITSFPQKHAFQIQFEATIINTSPLQVLDAETFLVTCKDTSLALVYGTVFTTTATPIAIETPALHIAFDSKTYFFGKGITHTITLCTVVAEADGSPAAPFYRWIQASREQFKKSTAIIFTTPESKGLAESLLLGYREELDTDTKEAFLKSGVSHLLAVSGMHTALIYEAIFLLFLPFGSSQKHRFVFLITALGILIYFTVLSGCSASVLRSSMMCSMFAIAYAFRKRSSGLNTLGTSMLLILWCSPYQLWNLGFQLSVLAVTGILTLHAFLSRQFSFTNRIYTYLFEGVSITVCAQITTLPVILYHFQSFPLYFIPANLILIPISTLALFASMLSICFAGLGIHATWIFACTQWLMELFAGCTAYIALLPNSSIQPICCSAIEAWGILVLVAWYMQYPFTWNTKTVGVLLVLCLGWTGYRIAAECKTEQQTAQVFISNGKRSALLSVHGLDAHIYTQQALKPFDRTKINAYFNITNLTEAAAPTNSNGLTAVFAGKQLVWLYKKNCTPVQQPVTYLFSYKQTDSILYRPQQYQSPLVKCLRYF